jgi:hypothetical protein
MSLTVEEVSSMAARGLLEVRQGRVRPAIVTILGVRDEEGRP